MSEPFSPKLKVEFDLIPAPASQCTCLADGTGEFSPQCVVHRLIAIMMPATPPPTRRIGPKPNPPYRG